MIKDTNMLDALLKEKRGDKFIKIDENLSPEIILQNSIEADSEINLMSAEIVFSCGCGAFRDYMYFNSERAQDLITQIDFLCAFQANNEMSPAQFIAFLEEYREVTETNPFSTLFSNIKDIEFGRVYNSEKELQIDIFLKTFFLNSRKESSPIDFIKVIDRIELNMSAVDSDYHYMMYQWVENGGALYSFAKVPHGLNYNSGEDLKEMSDFYKK